MSRWRGLGVGGGVAVLTVLLVEPGCVLDWPPPIETAAGQGGAGGSGATQVVPVAAVGDPACPCSALAAHVVTALPTGVTHLVMEGDDLQAALDAAEAGDEVVLEAGATFQGPFRLPVTSGEEFLTIRTADLDALPGPCTRLGLEHVAGLPRLVGPAGQPALLAADGAHHIRLIGIELTVDPGPPLARAIVELGTGDELDAALLPHDLVFDRVHVRGPAPASPNGFALDGGATLIINSRVTGIHNAPTPVHAIVGANGPGPYVLLNDYLESYGAQLRLGGGSSSLPGVVPADIEVRYSHLTRDPSWEDVGGSNYGTRWMHLANGRRVTLEGNLLEQAWDGYGLMLQPNDEASVIEDVSVLGNVFRRGVDGVGAFSSGEARVSGLSLRDNLMVDLSGRMLVLLGAGVEGLAVVHNTVLQEAHIFMAEGGLTPGMVFIDNIVQHNDYGMWCATFGLGTSCLDAMFPGYSVTGNVIVGLPSGNAPDDYPAGNYFPAYEVGFTDPAAGDYRLAPGTPFKAVATDGTDPGVDFAVLDAAATCRTP